MAQDLHKLSDQDAQHHVAATSSVERLAAITTKVCVCVCVCVCVFVWSMLCWLACYCECTPSHSATLLHFRCILYFSFAVQVHC